MAFTQCQVVDFKTQLLSFSWIFLDFVRQCSDHKNQDFSSAALTAGKYSQLKLNTGVMCNDTEIYYVWL